MDNHLESMEILFLSNQKKPSVSVYDEKIGSDTGSEATVGDVVVVSYEGKLADGTVFDSASSFKSVPVMSLKDGMWGL